MDLANFVRAYIEQPFPLWEFGITEKLVDNKWTELRKLNLLSLSDYSTARSYISSTLPLKNRYPIYDKHKRDTIYLEAPSFDTLFDFYQEHGLEPFSEPELEANAVLPKLMGAIALFDLVRPSFDCITKLVRSIQILKAEDEEIDISYSHPKIPFSIFISTCHDDSLISNIRVAESILHEAMHLKLTFIESILPLIKTNVKGLFFSPWRDEKRPAQGVLHGLFVFRAVLDFLNALNILPESDEVNLYIEYRKKQIVYEFAQINSFFSCPDLTECGAILTKNLLSLK